MVDVVFVHGALVRDGAWWWQPVAELVHQATGARSLSVALPSCGETTPPGEGPLAGLSEDAAALGRVLDEVDSAALVVGHSYGGTVVAQGADHPVVRHLLYVSSYLPDVGQTQADIVGDEPDPVSVAVDPDAGTVSVAGYDEGSFADRFCDDVSDERLRRGAWERVVPQGVGAFGTPTTRAAWQGMPSTYLVCTGDRSTTPALQRRHAERATESVDLPTGHHPFLSRPELVAEQVERIIRSL